MFMTPIMRVMPRPMSAYNPPVSTPETSVCRKTSIRSPGSVLLNALTSNVS